MRAADHPAAAWVLAGLAFALAAAGPRSQPGSHNDGSRLATAESLIERGTLVIDDSVFVHPPPDIGDRVPIPDEPDHDGSYLNYSLRHGTLDRVYVGGHFYSDKPMVPAILSAAAYRVLMPLGLPRPSERPDVFGQVQTVLTCGLGYAAAVGFMWVLGTRVGLPPAWRLVWLVSFALATVLPAYTRNVNAGIPQLAAVAGLAVALLRIANPPTGRTPWLALLAAGTCVGFAYTIDQASGAPLVLAAVAAVAVRTRRWVAVALMLAASAPWALAHHTINYAIGGVWVPMNMVPAYLDWPGTIFDESNMTGILRHDAFGLVAYFWLLLMGRMGFLVCHPQLFLALGFGWRVLVRPGPDRVELVALVAWGAAVVAIYTALSDNYGGSCLSIRWFVPLLVPAFHVLARLLVDYPQYRPDFAVLTAGGLVEGAMVWPCGPFLSAPIPPVNWVAGCTAAAWAAVRYREWKRAKLCRAPDSADDARATTGQSPPP